MLGFIHLIIIVCIASLPLVATFLYVKHTKAPVGPWLFFISIAAGALSMFFASLLQLAIPANTDGNQYALIYTVFFRNAFSEELGRLIILSGLFAGLSNNAIQKFLYNDEHWLLTIGESNRKKMMIYVGCIAGFAFAMLETLSYGLLQIQLVLIRTLTSAPLHAACGARVALALNLFDLTNRQKRQAVRSLLYFISAVSIHGLYNLFLLLPSVSGLIPIALAYVALAATLSLARIE